MISFAVPALSDMNLTGELASAIHTYTENVSGILDRINNDSGAPQASVTPVPAAQTVKPGHIEYARTTYNIYPVVQINTSWKRAAKNEPIEFDSGNTYDPDGYIISYMWDFGDGSMAEGKNVTHAYKEMGKYSVKFRVVDNGGADRTAYVTAIISNKPPVAVAGNDTNATAGIPVNFSAAGSYDPDGKVVKYEWAFGDGTTGKGMNVTHVYDRPDRYKVDLTVTDDSGSNATSYVAVRVSAPEVTTAANTKPAGVQGIVLLAGAGIALVALVVMVRKRK